MSQGSRRPLWPLLTAALIGLPVLYAFSFGPACWITTNTHAGKRAFQSIYWPMGWWVKNGPPALGDAIIWYAQIGIDYGTGFLPREPGPNPRGWRI